MSLQHRTSTGNDHYSQVENTFPAGTFRYLMSKNSTGNTCGNEKMGV